MIPSTDIVDLMNFRKERRTESGTPLASFSEVLGLRLGEDKTVDHSEEPSPLRFSGPVENPTSPKDLLQREYVQQFGQQNYADQINAGLAAEKEKRKQQEEHASEEERFAKAGIPYVGVKPTN